MPSAGVLGLLLLLRLFCVAGDRGRGASPPPGAQFIVPDRHAAPLYQPPTVPVRVCACSNKLY